MRRSMGIVLFFLGLTGLILSVIGVVATWRYRRILTHQSTQVATRAEELLKVAVNGLRQGEVLLGQAHADLDAFHKEAKAAGPMPPATGSLTKTLIKRLAGEYIPNLDSGHRLLNSSLDAAVAINSVLEGLGEMAPGRVTTLDTAQLKEMAGQVQGLIGSTQKLKNLLQEGDAQTLAEVAAYSGQVQTALTLVAEKASQLTERVGEVQDRVSEIKADLPRWLTTAAIVLTILLAWFALGQLSLTLRGWSWLWEQPGGE